MRIGEQQLQVAIGDVGDRGQGVRLGAALDGIYEVGEVGVEDVFCGKKSSQLGADRPVQAAAHEVPLDAVVAVAEFAGAG